MRASRASKTRAILAAWPLLAAAAGAQTPSPKPAVNGALVGTSWRLVQFQSGDDAKLTPPDPSKYTVAFGKDGRASFRVDCNRGSSSWKSEPPPKLEFGPMALTRAMCPPAPLTDRFARDMANVRSYLLKDGHLHLSLMADGGIYEFEPAAPKGAQAMTIDCTKATGEIEKLVCGDPDLSALDRKLAAVSAEERRKAGPSAAALTKTGVGDWIKTRDACGKSADAKPCLRSAYEARIARIQARSRQVPFKGPVTFACSSKPGDVLVATFHETEPPSAIFERGGKTAFALIARSGSGARYEAQGVLFWDKGGEAQVTWFGAQLKCSARKK